MANIRFFRCTSDQFANITDHSQYNGSIFFITDKGYFYISNGTENYETYAGNLKDAEFDGTKNKLTITRSDGSTVVADFGDRLLTDEDKAILENVKEALEGAGINPVYDPKNVTADNDLIMLDKVGGIPADTKATQLKGKTFTEMFTALLFPTVIPDYIAPSIKNFKTSVSSPIKVGMPAPAKSTFSATFDRGEIRINQKSQTPKVYRSGEQIGETIYYYGSESAEWPTSFDEPGDKTYTAKVNYGVGPQPKNNKGDDYDSPLAAGSLTTNTTINVTYPYFVTTSDGEPTEQALIKWTTTMASPELQIVGKSDTQDQIIIVPKELKTLIGFNNLTKAFDVDELPNWVHSTIDNYVGTRQYHKYVYGGANRDTNKFKITF